MTRIRSIALLALPVLLAAAAGAQEETDLAKEIRELKQGQQQIRRELAEIKRLLEAPPRGGRQPAPSPVAGKVFELGANPVMGESTAKVTLVEFSDYQWPYCARHVRETHSKIKQQYIDSGKIRYAMLDLPLERIHPQAFKAAEATHCAAEQGKFWEMHDRFFQHQRALADLVPHAEALGLDVESFKDCLGSDRHAPAVRADMAEARKAGATGTPSFVIAKTDPEDPTRVTGIAFLRGAQPFTAFKSQLDAALAAED